MRSNKAFALPGNRPFLDCQMSFRHGGLQGGMLLDIACTMDLVGEFILFQKNWNH